MISFWSRGFQPIQPQSNQATDPLVHPAATLEKGSAGREAGRGRQKVGKIERLPFLPSPSLGCHRPSRLCPLTLLLKLPLERGTLSLGSHARPKRLWKGLEYLQHSTLRSGVSKLLLFQLLDIAGPLCSVCSKEGTSKCIRYWFLHKRIEDGEDIN